MDPVSAFGLAGTCLQFIDTGARFTSLAFKLYRHNSDETDEYSAMLKITRDLDTVLPQLKAAALSSGNSGEQNLAKLTVDCSDSATRLEALLSKIKPIDKMRKRDALRAAFHAMCNEDEIAALQNQLASFRDQLNFHLLLCLRNYALKSAVEQKEILLQLGIAQNETKEIRGIAAAILYQLVSKGVPKDNRVIGIRVLQQDLVGTLYHEEELDSNRLNPRTIQLSVDQNTRAQKLFLSNLQYDSMIDRESRIAVAHETTFKWVLEDAKIRDNDAPLPKWSNFRAWLESADQLYWITGKAGSGKSTLMKYLCSPINQNGEVAVDTDLNNHDPVWRYSRCTSYLEKWAGDASIILASFYFWNSGQEIQATQEGLLRTLLRQILGSRPNLIASVAAQDWEAACLFDVCRDDWSTEELQALLNKVIEVLHGDSKICFFIDGLDEFEDNHRKLISMIKFLTDGNDHVKVCAASRPWSIFEESFDRKPSLRLEDLTFNDIKEFVGTKFAANPDFADLQKRCTSFARTLINNIVLKASGVFLWVDLVVQSLLTGMRLGDRIQDFQRRLDELPPDLEKLYDKILHNLDPFYLTHAAQYFSLVETAIVPPTILLFSFADEETPESAIQMDIHGLSNEQISLRVNAAVKRLNSRCKGLLEIDRGLKAISKETCGPDLSPGHECQVVVQYLHRTVRDYLRSRKAQDFLRPLMKAGFDPALQLVCGRLMETKMLFPRHPERHARYLLTDAVICFWQAVRIAKHNETHTIALLVEMRNVVEGQRERLNPSELYYAYRALYSGSENFLESGTYFHNDLVNFESKLTDIASGDCNAGFTFLALRAGLVGYLKKIMPKHAILSFESSRYVRQPSSWEVFKSSTRHDYNLSFCPLLAYALMLAPPNLQMIQCLLDHGADPNFQDSDYHISSWQVALTLSAQLLEHESSLPTADPQVSTLWREILKLLYVAGGHCAKIPKSELSALPEVTKRTLEEIRKEVAASGQLLTKRSSRWFGRKKRRATT